MKYILVVQRARTGLLGKDESRQGQGKPNEAAADKSRTRQGSDSGQPVVGNHARGALRALEHDLNILPAFDLAELYKE